MTLLVRKADAVARVVRTTFALTLSVCKECTASDGKCPDTPRPEGRCLDTLRPDARCRGSCVRAQVPWRVASRRTVPWRVATRHTVPWRVASRRTVPWRVASRRTVPWRAASGVARFRPLRLERLVRPDAVDANFFFPDDSSVTQGQHLATFQGNVELWAADHQRKMNQVEGELGQAREEIHRIATYIPLAGSPRTRVTTPEPLQLWRSPVKPPSTSLAMAPASPVPLPTRPLL